MTWNPVRPQATGFMGTSVLISDVMSVHRLNTFQFVWKCRSEMSSFQFPVNKNAGHLPSKSIKMMRSSFLR